MTAKLGLGKLRQGRSGVERPVRDRRRPRVAEAVRKKPAKPGAAAIGLAVGAVIDQHQMKKKHFALEIADGRFALSRKQDQIAAEARPDGIDVIRTSPPKDNIGSAAAVAAYRSLAQVERACQDAARAGW